jgi:hypothetical protein
MIIDAAERFVVIGRDAAHGDDWLATRSLPSHAWLTNAAILP